MGARKGPDVATAGADPLNLAQINAMDEARFVETFQGLYPGESWPVRAAYRSRPFASSADLRAAFQNSLMSGSPEQQRALIGRYRDIAELLLDENPGHTSADVAALTETGSLAADRMDDHDRDSLLAVAAAYQEKFALPLVVALSATTTLDAVVEQGWLRVEASPERELHKAIGEVANIADRRFDSLVADANPIRSAWARKFEALN